MPAQPGRLADGALGRLHGERVARAAAVVVEVDPAGEVLVEHRPRLPRRRRGRSRGRPAGRRRCPRSGRRRRARSARPSPPRPAPRAPGRAAGRGARSSGRACRACRRAAADGRAARRGAVRSRSSRSSYASISRMEERAASLRRAAPEDARARAGRGARCGGRRGASCRAGRGLLAEVSPSPGRRGRCRGARRGPRGRGTRRGSSGRPGSPLRRAARRSRARRRSRRAYARHHRSRRDDADHLAGADRLARARRTARGRRRRASACTSFSIFIASTMQITWPAATESPSATSTESTVPCIGLTTASRPPAPAALAGRARRAAARPSSAQGGSGTSSRDVEAAAVELDGRHALPEPAVRGCRLPLLPHATTAAACSASCSDSTTPWHVPPSTKHGWREQRAVEAEQRRHAADLELVERAQHPAPRVLAVDAVHDQLRDHRVVERRDLRAVLHARVDAHARAPPARGSPRSVPGVGQEAAWTGPPR